MESYDVEWKGRKNQSIFQVDSYPQEEFLCVFGARSYE